MLREGDDITICAWGTQIHVVKEAAQIAAEELDVSVEVIDLGKIYSRFFWIFMVFISITSPFYIIKSFNSSMG